LKIGWIARYLLHPLSFADWTPRAGKYFILTGTLASFMLAAPVPTALVSVPQGMLTLDNVRAGSDAPPATADPQVDALAKFLARYDVGENRLERIAKAIATSSRKHKVDARLIASIMIVESNADPLAISRSGAVGIMQIHVPTWGPMAQEEGLDLFKIEDNIELGARILKGYVDVNGLWHGVMRYRGWFDDDPASLEIANGYAQKVRRIYES
jgi:soluble lytic murein transglycosylase-like protein